MHFLVNLYPDFASHSIGAVTCKFKRDFSKAEQKQSLGRYGRHTRVVLRPLYQQISRLEVVGFLEGTNMGLVVAGIKESTPAVALSVAAVSALRGRDADPRTIPLSDTCSRLAIMEALCYIIALSIEYNEFMKTVLTGITPSGIPHLGNYIGAIKPSIEQSHHRDQRSMYFIADYHSLVKLWDIVLRQYYIYDIEAAWLALGLDPEYTIFYRQSHIYEIFELNWMLNTITAKGLLNRVHTYKDAVAKNVVDQQQDPDAAITMGLFGYPVLMTANILVFNGDIVPVGKDQVQHMEMARDIATRFNHVYGEVFHVPAAMIDEHSHTLPGLDGRKMSKSYDNTIPIFLPSKKLRKAIMKIKTNSQLPEEPKDTEGCSVFSLYRAFASAEQTAALAARYQAGIGWGEAKQMLFELLDMAFWPSHAKNMRH